MSRLSYKSVSLFSLLALSLIAVGCAGNKELTRASSSDIPAWYLTPPSDVNYLYGANTSASQDLQLSVDKATLGANQKLAQQLEVKIQGLQKSFMEEIGAADDSQLLQQFTQVSRAVVSQTLIGARVKEKKTVREGNVWRTYVLAELPVGVANKAFLDRLKAQDALLTRVRATETFKELDAEVSKLESSR